MNYRSIIKAAGAKRVSDDAVSELQNHILHEISIDIAQQAIALAAHAGRVTILTKDIQLASKNVLGESLYERLYMMSSAPQKTSYVAGAQIK